MAAVFLPVQASAATIGSDLTQGGEHELFACTWVDCRSDFQAVLPGRETQAPFDGIVRRWRVHAGGSGSVRLRIVRPIPGVGYRAVASSAVERTVEGINTFDTRLSIARGDMLGLDVVNGATGIFAPREGARAGTWWPAVPDGSETLASVSDGVEIALNADIDPDRDRDDVLARPAAGRLARRLHAPCAHPQAGAARQHGDGDGLGARGEPGRQSPALSAAGTPASPDLARPHRKRALTNNDARFLATRELA